MQQTAYFAFCCLLALCGCTYQAPLRVGDFGALAECSVQTTDSSSTAGAPRIDGRTRSDALRDIGTPTDRVGVATSVLPLQVPGEFDFQGSTTAIFARRVVVTFAPGSLQRGDSLLWTRLSLRTLGGTLAGWTRIWSHGVSIELASSGRAAERPAPSANREFATVEAGAGYITVERLLRTPRSESSALSLDLLIAPGGVPVDEPAVRIQQLWTKDGAPLTPDALQIDLVPARHAPGYDTVDADILVDYIVAHRGSGAGRDMPCRSSAQLRTTLVDKDAVRPALWDLGVASLNAPRTRWLALSSPAVGVIRAVFESPEAAMSFANWIRATQSTQAGAYRLGVFERSGRNPLRPFVPVDLSATETFHPLAPGDARALRVGPLGEP